MPGASWRRVLDHIQAGESFGVQLQRLEVAFAAAAPESVSSTVFGCFGFDPPDHEGVVRIHFNVQDRFAPNSPLHIDNLDQRQVELRNMMAHLRAHHPDASIIRGVSWLYNTASYCALFPPEYTRAPTPVGTRLNFRGSSSWGQFLTYQQAVKNDLAEIFINRLAGMTLEDIQAGRLGLLFPLPALVTACPVQTFYDYYL